MPEHDLCFVLSTTLEECALLSDAVRRTGAIAVPLNPEASAAVLELYFSESQPIPTVLIISSLGGNQSDPDADRGFEVPMVMFDVHYHSHRASSSDPPTESIPVPGSESLNSPPNVDPIPVAEGGFGYQDWINLIVPLCAAAGISCTAPFVEIPSTMPWFVEVGVILIALALALFLTAVFISPKSTSIARSLTMLGTLIAAAPFIMYLMILIALALALFAFSAVFWIPRAAVFWIPRAPALLP